MDAQPSEIRCPRCEVSLFAGQSDDLRVHGCGLCGGIWLDNEVSARVIQSLDERAMKLAEMASRHATVVAPTDRVDIPCPLCTKGMTRVPGAGGGVMLDTCYAHGTWFDRDELQFVANTMAARRPAANPYAAPAANPYAAPQTPAAGVYGGGYGQRGARRDEGGFVTESVAFDVAEMAVDVGTDIVMSGAAEAADEVIASAGAEAVSAVASFVADGAASAVVEGAGTVLAEAGGAVLEGAFSLLGSLFD